jgi:hypothetical protein
LYRSTNARRGEKWGPFFTWGSYIWLSEG